MRSEKAGSAETRRHFLKVTAAGAVGLTLGGSVVSSAVAAPAGTPPGPKAEPGRLSKLSEHLVVYHGPINVGIVRDGSKALLIDCGDGSVAGVLEGLAVTSVDQIVFTHHHRDQACGAHALAAGGARISVPAAERDHFDKVADYWAGPTSRWHLYNQHPHHLMLAEPVRVDAALDDGQELAWGPAKIRVLFTPGHTDGSVSYLVEVDGQRTVFSGDSIYDEGRIWEIYSLQKGFRRGDRGVSDYHGFLGARPQLVESLGRIKAAQPNRLVPSHGNIMADPLQAIDALVRQLDVCYDKYVAISALRHYFHELFSEFAGREDHMPIRPGRPAPQCLRHFGTTWMLVSNDKAAFAMDCGSPRVVEEIKKLLDKGEVHSVEGLWVTHYHDDHVDAIPEFQKEFDCQCITDRHVAEVITDPTAWRLPCISPSVARVDRPSDDGDSWQWHEFKMTAYHLPGQTLYHAGLFVEGQGLQMLFVGDSFTMSGIDDYCAHNRNWLGRGVGFDRCIELIEKLGPTHIFNCHVNEAFDFTPEECRFMRANLAEREELFGRLVPWEHANYGMDEPWVRCFPYEQKAVPGGEVNLGVVVTNHSAESRLAACRPVLPRSWVGAVAEDSSMGQADVADWPSAEVPAKSERQVPLVFRVPPNAKPGRYVIPVDLSYGERMLPQFQEAVVVV